MKVEGMFVKWQHNEGEGSTKCVVLDDDKNVVAEATVRRYYKDCPNIELARKFSLEQAIGAFDKELRAAFWEAFRTLRKQPKWGKACTLRKKPNFIKE